ncbi:hypothetical protein MTR67_040967 [Solanum verrucosum]|uniref:Cation efflux protein transmembrane domain-containing protein n=1 Tax=Solanum verrucosum TaxID=315347 RepID=A0AAF0ZPV7_SOLVR|nr:hypothetical protein MTR67_040967 [Solanum verrucosum]
MLHNRWQTGDSYSHLHVHHDVRSGMTERGFSGLDLLLILALPPEKLLQIKYVEAPPLLLMRFILSPMWLGEDISLLLLIFAIEKTHITIFSHFSYEEKLDIEVFRFTMKYRIVLCGVSLLSFQAARVPKDKEHPCGWHALDVLLGLWSAASEVVNQSMTPLHVHEQHHHGIDMDHPILALSVTILSIAVKEGSYWITKREGERVGSGLIEANAWHHRAEQYPPLLVS